MNKFDDQNSFPRFSDDNLVEDDNNIDNITSVTLDYNISDANANILANIQDGEWRCSCCTFINKDEKSNFCCVCTNKRIITTTKLYKN